MSYNLKELRLNNDYTIPPIGIGLSAPNYGHKRIEVRNHLINRVIGAFYSRILHPLFLYPSFINAISHALKSGYRLVDNSAAYSNERLVGRAIRKSNIPREELIITSRLTNRAQMAGTVREEFNKTLRDLGTDYIDIYMFHWPVSGCYLSAWRQMEILYEEGLVKTIGVANCHRHHLEEILKIAKVKPAINQIEIHPLFSQKPLIEYCKSKGIVVEAYTPIARNDDRFVRSRILEDIANKYDKSIPQVALRWHIQNGVIPVPRSLNKKRQIENISIFDFTLNPEEMKKIDSLNINSRLRYDPDNCDFTRL